MQTQGHMNHKEEAETACWDAFFVSTFTFDILCVLVLVFLVAFQYLMWLPLSLDFLDRFM